MFSFILILAIALLTVGFIAMLLAVPLEMLRGADARAAGFAKAVGNFCGKYSLWAGGFIASLFLLVWLHDHSRLLWSMASILIGISAITYFGGMLFAAIGTGFIACEERTKKAKAAILALGAVFLAGGALGVWHSVRLFLVPVYSAIA